MQQDRGRTGRSDHQGMKQNNQQQNQTFKAQQQQQQQQQQQKCPRCDSLNTKFCYYNNYSLSQPRYLCKTCRRYWTQGGTLRNVPVGGGCRKGKRAKISSSSAGEDSRSTRAPQVLSQQATQTPLSMSCAFRTNKSSGMSISSTIPSIGSYYPGARSLSSLTSIKSMNEPQPRPFNQLALDQALNIDGDGSNLCLLHGYGMPSFGSQHHQPVQRTQFFPMGDRDQKSCVNILDACDSSQHNWHHQGFTNNNDPTFSEAAMLSFNNNNNNNNNSSNTSNAGKTNTSNTIGDSFNPNQWLDLPGYGAPP